MERIREELRAQEDQRRWQALLAPTPTERRTEPADTQTIQEFIQEAGNLIMINADAEPPTTTGKEVPSMATSGYMRPWGL